MVSWCTPGATGMTLSPQFKRVCWPSTSSHGLKKANMNVNQKYLAEMRIMSRHHSALRRPRRSVPGMEGLPRTGVALSETYQHFAEREVGYSSPSYAAICLGIAADPAILDRLGELPVDKRQPNLLLGAVRGLGGRVTAYPAYGSCLRAQRPDVAAAMLVRRTRTKEI